MRDNTMWAGGAEVVALTHVLKRPVHVYELESTGRRWVRMSAPPLSALASGPVRRSSPRFLRRIKYPATPLILTEGTPPEGLGSIQGNVLRCILSDPLRL